MEISETLKAIKIYLAPTAQAMHAINQDKLPWKNVSDLNGFKNSVAKTYAITELPTNYLLEPEGKIIGKNLKGDSLTEKLKSLLGE
jgi:hypothetical protein